MRAELDLRLLRAFVAVAEELHFTRAANRLYVAQQALSRDIRRLETQVGARLFVRSTRQVTLTPDGERLLVHARSLLELNDAALQDLSGEARPLLVDVIGEGLTAARIVDEARMAAPQLELTVRYGGGMGAALTQLLAGRVEVAFGRTEGLGAPFPAELTRRLVRWEPLALLMSDDHPLADLAEVPMAELDGVEIDASSGNDVAPEWVDLAASLLADHGARPSPPHPHVVGTAETARHLRSHGLPILTMSECPEVPGAVVRPLVDPVPVYPWAVVHHRDANHPGLAALDAVMVDLAAEERWTALPEDAWVPAADAQWVRRP
ncbi:LysR family transcriptional regulator [Nocardioides guangzhouensis]|uniref:LysR family transcriptional regulator n=1 Tax=Nocardioides guangzhouensis TaxID=2497878 RepID=A0A4Q4ZDX9_9ACTN|nr:LysR family transcriptional regulator [Nocardioides guangzhouensis]